MKSKWEKETWAKKWEWKEKNKKYIKVKIVRKIDKTFWNDKKSKKNIYFQNVNPKKKQHSANDEKNQKKKNPSKSQNSSKRSAAQKWSFFRLVMQSLGSKVKREELIPCLVWQF